MSYNNRIQNILKVYYESGPLNYPILVKYLYPWISHHESKEIIEYMLREELVSPVSKSLGKYKITEKGRFVMQTGGWVFFLQKNGSVRKKQYSI
jgi:hypothetical protein